MYYIIRKFDKYKYIFKIRSRKAQMYKLQNNRYVLLIKS